MYGPLQDVHFWVGSEFKDGHHLSSYLCLTLLLETLFSSHLFDHPSQKCVAHIFRFKLMFVKTLHACLLPFEDSHIITRFWTDNFCPFGFLQKIKECFERFFFYVKNNFNLTCDSKSYSISSFLYIIFAIINKTPLTFNWIGDVMDKRKYPYCQSDSAPVIIRRIMIVILLYIGTTERWRHILTEKQQIQSIQNK
jgi:hypothetical protein